MCDTIQKSGGDAAVIRIHKKEKAISVSVDSSANYCNADAKIGGKQIICENWRNLISVGSKPLAITNCLNFGSPEKPEVMGEFVECVQGISEASKYLNIPEVSGNVPDYSTLAAQMNESRQFSLNDGAFPDFHFQNGPCSIYA